MRHGFLTVSQKKWSKIKNSKIKDFKYFDEQWLKKLQAYNWYKGVPKTNINGIKGTNFIIKKQETLKYVMFSPFHFNSEPSCINSPTEQLSHFII